jgi:hypothetical protein
LERSGMRSDKVNRGFKSELSERLGGSRLPV